MGDCLSLKEGDSSELESNFVPQYSSNVSIQPATPLAEPEVVFPSND